jgi:hypothetical protein
MKIWRQAVYTERVGDYVHTIRRKISATSVGAVLKSGPRNLHQIKLWIKRENYQRDAEYFYNQTDRKGQIFKIVRYSMKLYGYHIVHNHYP